MGQVARKCGSIIRFIHFFAHGNGNEYGHNDFTPFGGNLVDKLMTPEEYSIDPDFSILFPPLPAVGRSGLWHFLHCNSESVEKRKKDFYFRRFSLDQEFRFRFIFPISPSSQASA